ncbi:TPA: superantigen-like protein, partial [Staphylococcus aureus]|nr:superantigen-like protein [Staphylococcus aureus]
MSKNITKNIILTTTLLLLGTVLPQNQKPVFSFYSEAKAYSIGQDETNINELIKYYTQPHFSFSNKWLYQYDNGNIYVELKRYSWSAHISLWGAESWGNINQLKDRYVDVFGLKDK